MIQSITDTLERSYNASKEYAPVLAMATIMLFSVIAAGGLYTQPVTEEQSGSVQAQTSGEDLIAVGGGNNAAVFNGSGDKLFQVSGSSPVRSVAIERESGYLFVGYASNQVGQYDLDGNKIRDIPHSGANGLDIQDGETTLYIAKDNNNVVAYDIETTSTVWTKGTSENSLGDVAVNEDMGKVAAVGDLNTYLLHSSNGSEITTRTSSGSGNWLEFSTQTGKLYESARSDGNYRRLNPENLNVVWSVGADSETVSEVTADNRVVAGRQSSTTYSHLIDNGTLNKTYSAASYSREGGIVGGSGGDIYISTLFNNNLVKSDLSEETVKWETSIGFEPTERVIDVSKTAPPPEFDPNLEIETRSYLPHNSSSPYTVYYTDPETGEVTNVNDDSGLTVNSSNTSVFTLDTSANEVVATSDTSINQREQFTAEYEGLTTQENVTVANQTVENLPILPGITRVGAVYSDSNIALILVGTLLGVVATRVASAFAGLGAIQLTLVAGWFVDLVSLGVVIVSLFAALFIGLNMAANIDYTVRR